MITELSQKLFDIKVVLKTALRSTEYSLSTEFHSMTNNYRIWGFFMIMYPPKKRGRGVVKFETQ